MSDYTLKEINYGEYRIKSSIFNSISLSVISIDEVKTQLSFIKEQYTKASHIAYAYRIKNYNRLDEFCSDGGEPRGSAGLPILNILKRNNLVNAIIFVVRYFGGIKLGIPGMINGYGYAANNSIVDKNIIPWVDWINIEIKFKYQIKDKIEFVLNQHSIKINSRIFKEEILYSIKVNVLQLVELKDELKVVTNNNIKFN